MKTVLRNLRHIKGLSTYHVAAAVGTSQSHYSRVESGLKTPSPGLADRIAQFFAGHITRDQILFPHDYPVGKRTRRKAS